MTRWISSCFYLSRKKNSSIESLESLAKYDGSTKESLQKDNKVTTDDDEFNLQKASSQAD